MAEERGREGGEGREEREESERGRGEEGRNCHDKSTSFLHCRLYVIKEGANGRRIREDRKIRNVMVT